MKKVCEWLIEVLDEVFEERSAIAEFDGGLPRDEAEKMARQEVDKIREMNRG